MLLTLLHAQLHQTSGHALSSPLLARSNGACTSTGLIMAWPKHVSAAQWCDVLASVADPTPEHVSALWMCNLLQVQ